ncbi:hypothetical protein GW915_01520 [bacterium]|nr:hypothetical protein [bacterium]
MSLLKYNLENLFSDDVQALVRHESGFDFKEAKSRFESFTQDASASIYSGYREDLLKSSDLSELKACAEKLQKLADVLVVCGIGGSSLGAQSVLSALGKSSKVLFLDNLDSFHFERSFAQLDLGRTALLIISKSGGTIESMVNAARVMDLYKTSGIDFKERTVAVTTDGAGSLYSWAQENNLDSFYIPQLVGGRFSLMTPAGLLPLAFADVNIDYFLAGARQELNAPEPQLWPLAKRLNELEVAGMGVLTLWPYASVLFDWGRWFQQLWGESLGKRAKNGVGVGSFPAACVGANDQHSLLQFLIEGSPRCVSMFVCLKSWEGAEDWMVSLPKSFHSKLGFSQGRKYSEILNAEAKATQGALSEVGRPSFELLVEKLDETNLGALYAHAMDLTVACGALKEINPFDQPGVEIGKKILPSVLES